MTATECYRDRICSRRRSNDRAGLRQSARGLCACRFRLRKRFISNREPDELIHTASSIDAGQGPLIRSRRRRTSPGSIRPPEPAIGGLRRRQWFRKKRPRAYLQRIISSVKIKPVRSVHWSEHRACELVAAVKGGIGNSRGAADVPRFDAFIENNRDPRPDVMNPERRESAGDSAFLVVIVKLEYPRAGVAPALAESVRRSVAP